MGGAVGLGDERDAVDAGRVLGYWVAPQMVTEEPVARAEARGPRQVCHPAEVNQGVPINDGAARPVRGLRFAFCESRQSRRRVAAASRLLPQDQLVPAGASRAQGRCRTPRNSSGPAEHSSLLVGEGTWTQHAQRPRRRRRRRPRHGLPLGRGRG